MPVISVESAHLQVIHEAGGVRGGIVTGIDAAQASLIVGRTPVNVGLDSSSLCTFFIAIALVVYGCFRSIKFEQDNKTSDDGNSGSKSARSATPASTENDREDGVAVETMDTCQAICLPFGASASLLIMFYFFDSFQLLFTLCTGVLATVAFAFLLLPLCQYVTKSLCGATYMISQVIFGRYTLAHVMSSGLAVLIVLCWVATGHWLLMDALSVGLCVAFIAFIRLPSLKVSTLLLIGLLLYDLFWVFGSSYVFSTNVMMKVATRPADNPFGVLARKLNLYSGEGRSIPKLSLPGKLVFPSAHTTGNFAMLGLGDIVLPGLVLCFVLRYDAIRRNQLYPADTGLPLPASYYQRVTYFHCSLIGYFLGLLTATLSSQLFDAAQPALLYLVPFTLLPLFLMAYMKGDLRRMWSEPFQLTQPSKLVNM